VVYGASHRVGQQGDPVPRGHMNEKETLKVYGASHCAGQLGETGHPRPSHSRGLTCTVWCGVVCADNAEEKCAQRWAQCGGAFFNGPQCCTRADDQCQQLNGLYSQCVPKPVA
jgi:hypothetical protein